MSVLRELTAWYAAQCDGDWEHERGVKIETLDNPGWAVVVDLIGTPAHGRAFERVATTSETDEEDWLHCEVKDDRFEGACGPKKLEDLLRRFLEWAAG
jgi:hypothetical protein